VASSIDCLQPYYFHTHLIGSEGTLLDNKFHSTKLALNKHKWSELSLKLCDSGDVSDHPYTTQFEAFFNALAAGKDMTLTSFDDAAKSHEVIFAADKSAELGRPVKMSEMK
jgi:predicted dehydrogenase